MRILPLLVATTISALAAAAGTAGVAADHVVAPTSDPPGVLDHPLLPRDPGAVVVDQTVLDLGRVSLPAGPLAPVGRDDADDGTGDGDDEQAASTAAADRELVGRITRTVYLSPEGRDPLEVFRGYREVVRQLGGEILFECTSRACGGDVSIGAGPARADGRTGIITSLFPPGQRLAAEDSPGGCAVRGRHRNQRYLLARLPEPAGIHAAVLTYTLARDEPSASGCGALADRAVAVVLVAEPAADPPEAAAGDTASVGVERPAVAGRPRVFIHHAAADADGAALARELAERLGHQALAVVEVRAVPFAIGAAATGVRYFFADDRDAARRLLRDAAPFLSATGRPPPRTPTDFTHYAPRPRPGTVEVWLPGG